jgi:hypothetical protein
MSRERDAPAEPARLEGRATPEGTAAWTGRFAPAHPHGYAALGRTGLVTSRVGFGGYRVDDETPEHRAALEAALLAGCNLIDTSTNYTDGGSERLAGAVLADLVRAGRAPRDGVVVVSKIGYVQGQNLRLAVERERAGTPFPEMVRYMDGCWHCIHPEFLLDQLRRSRDRLGLGTLDVCLLHNPEYFLSDARKHGAAIGAAREEFDRRLRAAFGFLEGAVERGAIGWYGVSSNTAVVPADDFEVTSVARMLAAAEAAGGPGHHFGVLQIPMNLLEPGGALEPNTGAGGRRTPLETAAAAGVGVLVNRPLNAILGNRLFRLADVRAASSPPGGEDPAATLQALEREFRAGPAAALEPAAGQAMEQLLDLIGQVAALSGEIEDFEQWRQIEERYVDPRLRLTTGAVGAGLRPGREADWRGWWDRFLPALEGLRRRIGAQAAARSNARTAAVRGVVDPLIPEGRRAESLSRKAIGVLLSTPGVSSALVGMRRPAYVEDVLGVLSWPPLPEPLAIYRRLEGVRGSGLS